MGKNEKQDEKTKEAKENKEAPKIETSKIESLNSLANFHLPRWGELPNIPLYMDQVIFILDQALIPFAQQEKTITPAMINNYVKNGALAPPVKKKYDRGHVAALLAISMLKRVLSIQETVLLLSTLTAEKTQEESYNLFCQKLEKGLQEAFGEGKVIHFSLLQEQEPKGPSLLDGAIAALVGKIWVQKNVQPL